tara:strand:- start:789 stop:965 length:177 start_codon:yes stop_codon:yes gene_type:complete
MKEWIGMEEMNKMKSYSDVILTANVEQLIKFRDTINKRIEFLELLKERKRIYGDEKNE